MADADNSPSASDVDSWTSPNCLIAQACKELQAESPEEWKKLCEHKSEFGWTLDKASVTARKLKQHVGVYAGDADCFTSMGSMFDKVILKYHQIDVNTNVAAEETYEKVTLPALPEGAIASTRIRTARNVKSLPFTVNMTKEQRLKLEEMMQKVFAGFENEHLKGKYHPMVGMPEEDRVKYVDLHYLYINDDPTLELVGCYDDWPAGRGIFINENQEKGVFIVWVGEEDQLRIMAMAKRSDVQAVWDLFYSGVEAVHKGIQASIEWVTTSFSTRTGDTFPHAQPTLVRACEYPSTSTFQAFQPNKPAKLTSRPPHTTSTFEELEENLDLSV